MTEAITEDVSRHINICGGCSAHRTTPWGIVYTACVPAEVNNRNSTAKPNMVSIPSNCPNNFIATATEKPILKTTVS